MMGKWKISGIVTDETPGKNDGMVTLVEGMYWPDEVPVTLSLAGAVSSVVGLIKLSKSVVDGRPVVLGEGDAVGPTVDDLARMPIGFAMCGLIERTEDRFDADGGLIPTATKVRVTHVAFQELEKCFSPDYVVTFERVEDAAEPAPSDVADGPPSYNLFEESEPTKLPARFRAWREEMAEIMDTAFGAPEVANGTLGNLASVAKAAQAKLVDMVERRGVTVAMGEVEVHWSAGKDEFGGFVEMDPRVVAELDEKAKPRLRLVEPVEDEREPQSPVVELVRTLDFPPLPAGHKRLMVVNSNMDAETWGAFRRAVIDRVGDGMSAAMLQPGETLGVCEFPPKAPDHKRIITVDTRAEEAWSDAARDRLREIVDADEVVMARGLRVEDVPNTPPGVEVTRLDLGPVPEGYKRIIAVRTNKAGWLDRFNLRLDIKKFIAGAGDADDVKVLLFPAGDSITAHDIAEALVPERERVEYSPVPFPLTPERRNAHIGDYGCSEMWGEGKRREAFSCVDMGVVVLLWGDDDEVGAASVQFALFNVLHYGGTDGFPDAYEVCKIDSTSGLEATADMAGAEVWATGWLKFDGCVNYTHPHAERCMPHVCGLEGFKAELGWWKLIYHLAGRFMMGTRGLTCPESFEQEDMRFVEVPLDEAKRLAKETRRQ